VVYVPLPKDLSAPEDGDITPLQNSGSHLPTCIPESHHLHRITL